MTTCPSRYHLNRAVTCWNQGTHEKHEGIYVLAGSVVTWTDVDKPPTPPAPRPEPPTPPAPRPEPPTAMQEAFARARQIDPNAPPGGAS